MWTNTQFPVTASAVSCGFGYVYGGVIESKKGGTLRLKRGTFRYEFKQVLAITKPFISSGCFKKIISWFEFVNLLYSLYSAGFSFTNIHESQDCRGRGKAFL